MKWPDELIFMKNSKLPQKETQASMRGLLSVVSGSTSGVGLATLKMLAQAGSDLVIVCRNKDKAVPIQEKLMQEYHVHVDIVVADFSKFGDVRNAAQHIIQTYPKIHVLINSVGIHSTTKKFNEDGYELCLAVNHLSTFLFSKLLIPKMIESAPARIIQINSEGHRFSSVKLKDLHFKRRIYTGLKGYGQSKTAQLLTVWELNDRLKGTGVTINACHPGAVKTAIGNNNGWLYRFFFRHVTSHFLKDPIISGKAIYYLAADPELRETSGRFFNLTIDELPAKHAIDRTLSPLVYQKSLEMVGLPND